MQDSNQRNVSVDIDCRNEAQACESCEIPTLSDCDPLRVQLSGEFLSPLAIERQKSGFDRRQPGIEQIGTKQGR